MTRTALHLFPTFAIGGTQRRFAQVARGVPGWRHVIVPFDGVTDAYRLLNGVERDYRRASLRRSGGLSWSNVSTLQMLIRGVSPHLLCTYGWGSMAGVLANRTGPNVPHLHLEDGFSKDEAARELTGRRLVRRLLLGLGGPHLAVPSDGLTMTARRRWRVPSHRLHRIDNGVDLDRFVPQEDRPAKAVYLGTLRPEKNVARLVQAANETGVSLDIWGLGPDLLKLHALAGSTVRFRGETDKPERALAEAGVLALSSDTEQMPLTVLEAMAAGMPVVSTDVGDVATMLSATNRPFVTPLGDDAAFAGALLTLTNDRALAARIGAANRAEAEARFGLDKMVQAHASLMDLVASKA